MEIVGQIGSDFLVVIDKHAAVIVELESQHANPPGFRDSLATHVPWEKPSSGIDTEKILALAKESIKRNGLPPWLYGRKSI